MSLSGCVISMSPLRSPILGSSLHCQDGIHGFGGWLFSRQKWGNPSAKRVPQIQLCTPGTQ